MNKIVYDGSQDLFISVDGMEFLMAGKKFRMLQNYYDHARDPLPIRLPVPLDPVYVVRSKDDIAYMPRIETEEWSHEKIYSPDVKSIIDVWRRIG